MFHLRPCQINLKSYVMKIPGLLGVTGLPRSVTQRAQTCLSVCIYLVTMLKEPISYLHFLAHCDVIEQPAKTDTLTISDRKGLKAS